MIGRIAAGALLLVAGTSGTLAANIRLTPYKHLSVVVISGEIKAGDDLKFMLTAASAKHHILVDLSGPGGALIPALKIAAIIRQYHWPTIVRAQNTCASACAFIWLAGESRDMEVTGRLGFHGAYVETKTGPHGASDGNAIVGAYLDQLGLPLSAIAYLTGATPDKLRWITPSVAAEIGLPVTFFAGKVSTQTLSLRLSDAAKSNIRSTIQALHRDFIRRGWSGVLASLRRCQAAAVKSGDIPKAQYCVAYHQLAANFADWNRGHSHSIPKNLPADLTRASAARNDYEFLGRLDVVPASRSPAIAQWSAFALKELHEQESAAPTRRQ